MTSEQLPVESRRIDPSLEAIEGEISNINQDVQDWLTEDQRWEVYHQLRAVKDNVVRMARPAVLVWFKEHEPETYEAVKDTPEYRGSVDG